MEEGLEVPGRRGEREESENIPFPRLWPKAWNKPQVRERENFFYFKTKFEGFFF